MMLSSANLQRDLEHCRVLGVQHIRKPIRKSDLLRVIEQITSNGPRSRSTSPVEPPKETGVALPRLSILVVDDNTFNQRVATMKMERNGHKVRVADCGGAALAALAEEEFDVMFTDIQMPDMDGFELTAEIRRCEQEMGRRLPVIAMTAHAMKGDRERCLAAGMDGYVAKPIQDSELWEAIRRVLPARTGAAEAEAPAIPPPSSRLDAALARVGGSMESLRELVEVFHQDCPSLIVDIESAIRDGDAQAAFCRAHPQEHGCVLRRRRRHASRPGSRANGRSRRLRRRGRCVRRP